MNCTLTVIAEPLEDLLVYVVDAHGALVIDFGREVDLHLGRHLQSDEWN